MKVVAEGVETRLQLEQLRMLECDEVQGYFISRPVPEEELIPLMKKDILYSLSHPAVVEAVMAG